MEQNHIYTMAMKALEDSIVEKKSNFFSKICKDYNQVPLNMVVDYMFKVIDAHVDGMGDLGRIRMSLYDVFGCKELSVVDKIVALTILSSQYELFLKKSIISFTGKTMRKDIPRFQTLLVHFHHS